jgi:uncharacterized protein YhfF
MSPQTRNFWDDFCRLANVEAEPFDIDCFGDSPAMADELLALVLSGEKRATCALERSYFLPDMPGRVPGPGDFSIILDGRNQARAVIHTHRVDIAPVEEVTGEFAFEEGEGDKSRKWWLEAHHGFFQREADALGLEYHGGLNATFERFELVYAPELGPGLMGSLSKGISKT